VTDIIERESSIDQIKCTGDSGDDRASILIVDDRTDKLMALEAVLASLGQNLVLAHSGTEALRFLLQKDFALIVLDVSMPEMDGFETASLIRQRKNSELTPIIFISAVNYSEAYLSRGYSLGAVDYILAPIVPEILRAKASVFIDLHKKTEQIKRHAEMRAQLIRLEAAREEAEAANKAKDHLIAMLSHELRTPLTPVLFASAMLMTDQTVPQHVREALDLISRNVQLEARLIDDLLDITRISNGKFSLRLEIVDVHELLSRACEICMGDASAKNLTVQFQLAALEHGIHADAARLEQAFWNLIKNAIKFTEPPGQIILRSSNPERGLIRVEVVDGGVGIDPTALPRIFDPFEQSGDAGSGGLGLGLTITKAIVELHGGRISAFSAGPNRGAKFVIELPDVIESSVERALSEQTVNECAATHYRILLVDDHIDSVRGAQVFLERMGYLVTTSDSVTAALRIAARQKFDLLVSDIGLPDGNGEDLIRQLRAKGHNLPGIALSGYGTEQDMLRSRAAGFQVHLVKPVLPQDILAAIDRLLGRSGSASATSHGP
jgi:signal transduction histidine kinase